jgi:hypothetical protein
MGEKIESYVLRGKETQVKPFNRVNISLCTPGVCMGFEVSHHKKATID